MYLVGRASGLLGSKFDYLIVGNSGEIQQLVKDLHKIYHAESALYSDDFTNDGFQWIDCHDASRGVITYIRKDKHSDDELTVVCNFKPHAYHNYWLGVNQQGTYEEILNTDDQKYGGSGCVNTKLEAKQWESNPWPYALEITIPALSVMIFRRC